MEPNLSNDPKTRRPRREFSDEFKASAVRLVVEEKQSPTKVAKDLDLTETSLREWVRRASVGNTEALSLSERDELLRLRKENRVLKMERDILKKAAAFFARENA